MGGKPNRPTVPSTSENADFPVHTVGILLLGDRRAGRTQLLRRMLAHDARRLSAAKRDEEEAPELNEKKTPDLNAEAHIMRFECRGHVVRVDLWTPAGGRDVVLPKLGAFASLPASMLHFIRSLPAFYQRVVQAVLVCFDLGGSLALSSTMEEVAAWQMELNKMNRKTYTQIPIFFAGVLPITRFPSVVSSIYALGLKTDLIPSLLLDPWTCARQILVAAVPSVDKSSAFAVLPREIVFQIASIYYAKKRHLEEIEDRDLPLSTELRTNLLENYVEMYRRPIYLASADENVGVKELLYSIVEDVLKNHYKIRRNQDGTIARTRHNPFSVQPRAK